MQEKDAMTAYAEQFAGDAFEPPWFFEGFWKHTLALPDQQSRLLWYHDAFWRAMPYIIEEWNTSWDSDMCSEYAAEWGADMQSWGQLVRFAEAGALTQEQHERYTLLVPLVARYRPIMERLLRE